MTAHEARRQFATEFGVPDGGRYLNDWTDRVDDVLVALAAVRVQLEQTEQERDLANACIDALEIALFGSLEGRSRDTLESRAVQLEQTRDALTYIAYGKWGDLADSEIVCLMEERAVAALAAALPAVESVGPTITCDAGRLVEITNDATPFTAALAAAPDPKEPR